VKTVFFHTLLLVMLFGSLMAQRADSFKESQMKHRRVKNAYQQRYSSLKEQLKQKGFQDGTFDVLIRVFKKEQEMEIWLKAETKTNFVFFKTYSICSSSGVLGPKRKQGDGQVPEGFYEISHFNPNSSYHLSLKVNYPNASDLKKASTNPGGDIMIHGECVTIGCVPIQNIPIEELYVLCVESKNKGHIIKAHFFPFRFNSKNSEALTSEYPATLNEFWKPLKEVYSYFEEKHIIPDIRIDKNGNYYLSK
jgi:murein L,D-transpeptidase YafK